MQVSNDEINRRKGVSTKRFNAEAIAVETLERLIRELNNNYCRAREVLDAKFKKLQHDVAKKKAAAREEIEFLKQKNERVEKITEEKKNESQEMNAITSAQKMKEEHNQLEEDCEEMLGKYETVLVDLEEYVKFLSYCEFKLINRLDMKQLIGKGFHHIEKMSKLHMKNNVRGQEF